MFAASCLDAQVKIAPRGVVRVIAIQVGKVSASGAF